MISNLSIKAKLVLLLLAPLVTLLVFAGIAVADRFDTAGVANAAAGELEVAQSAMSVIGELSTERSTAVQLLINSRDGRADADAAREQTDAAVAELTGLLENGGFNLDSGAGALNALQRIAATRQQVDTFAVESPEAYAGYNGLIDGLLALETEVLGELGDTDLLQQGQLTLAGIRGRETVSRQTAFLGPRLELVELTGPDYVAFAGLQNEEQLFFNQLNGSDEISELWQASRTSQAAAAGDSLVDAVNAAGQGGSIPNVTANVWWNQMTAKAESFDPAAVGSFDRLLANADAKASSARNGAILFGAVAGVIVLLAILMALALGRSIARRLLRLSEEANMIATERLPEVLESLRNPTPEALSGAMPTIDSDATDEIGVMADSFDTVLRTSVETSIEHSQQRAKTITDLLVNLGRRNQALIGRQLALIDELEAKEEDPDLLESLYSLDSLITRNRRNSENLLVLAGETASRSANAPVSLYEIVQGAMGEVSDLERVEVTEAGGSTELLLGKPAVNLSHLVAELLDNALAFSAKTTKVTAHIESAMGEHRIWVIDEGVGMDDAELAEANARIADPSDIDDLSTDRIGFQVIGRIAQRLGATVTFTQNPYGGLAAKIDVPRDLLLSSVPTPVAEIVEEPTAAPAGGVQAEAHDGVFETLDAPSVSTPEAPVVPAPAGSFTAPSVSTPEAPVVPAAAAPIAPAPPSPAHAAPAQAAPAQAAPTAAAPAGGTPVAPVQITAVGRAPEPPQQPQRSAHPAPPTIPPAVPPVPAHAAPSAPGPLTQLSQRTPGASLANELRAEAEDRVTHRRLGDGTPKLDTDIAERRQAMNSRLAQSIEHRQTKE